MVSSITGQQSSNVLAGLSPQGTNPSGSTASFTDQLAAALEGYLAQSSSGSNLEINIQTTQSQNSGVRQFIVTVKNPESALAPAASTSTPAVAPQPQAASTNAVAATVPLDENARANLTRAKINAYWAAQPEEVQKLRTVNDFGERSLMAQQLADEGYTIDRQIMVWGWDPMKTMATRKMYGYDWVPSYNQASVSTPGMAVTGQTPYDAAHPAAGSIAVNTDFANGLGITDPFA